MSEKEARAKMAVRLMKGFKPTTEHGDKIELDQWEAEEIADIFAEYVASVMKQERA